MTEKAEPTILIVDDEPDLCEMLAFELSSKGYNTLAVCDGQEAIRLLDQTPVSVIVTDIRMPRFSGMELLNHVKSLDVAQPAVILITALSDVEPSEFYHQGAEAFLSKPFRLARLVRDVTHMLKPPLQRWSAPSSRSPVAQLNIRIPDFQTGRQQGLFALGRGGAQFSLSKHTPQPGAQVAFNVEIESGPIQNIQGHGIVRWIWTDPHTHEQPACGVEFEFINDAIRQQVVNWIEDQQLRSFIPCLHLETSAAPKA